MSWVWIVTGIVVLSAALAASGLLRRLVWAFALAVVALLVLHMQTNPAEGAAALAALGGGLALARTARRVVTGGIL